MSASKALSRPPSSQGMKAILVEGRVGNVASSIRRSLSADMSSKSWLDRNCFFSQIKKANAGVEGEECERNPCQDDDVWRNIQQEKESRRENSGSLMTHKSHSSVLPPPYVHRRSLSLKVMSEKSLQICTESVGSETGSDYSSPASIVQADRQEKDGKRANSSRSPAQPLPPPLPSLSGRVGTSLNLHSRREDGRLLLEAVPPRNGFLAQRRNGRLVLTLPRIGAAPLEEGDEAVYETAKNLEAIGNKNLRMTTEKEKYLVTTSLPPPTPHHTAASASFNSSAAKITAAPQATKLKRTKNVNKNGKIKISGARKWNSNEGCKETRKPILFWDPYCIATS